MKRNELVKYLDKTLKIKKFKRKWKESNGLIIRGKNNIKKIGIAVNVSKESIEKAIKNNIDFLITHHAAWKWMPYYKKKLSLLRKNKINLYVVHESLDQAKDIGMAFILAKELGIKIKGRFLKERGDVDYTGVYGFANFSFNELIRRIKKTLKIKPKVFRFNKKFKKIGIVTGGAYRINFIQSVLDKGCDTYITGEDGMFGNIFAKENNLNYISATHYSTESLGMINLGKLIENNFCIKTIFIKEENLG